MGNVVSGSVRRSAAALGVERYLPRHPHLHPLIAAELEQRLHDAGDRGDRHFSAADL